MREYTVKKEWSDASASDRLFVYFTTEDNWLQTMISERNDEEGRKEIANWKQRMIEHYGEANVKFNEE